MVIYSLTNDRFSNDPPQSPFSCNTLVRNAPSDVTKRGGPLNRSLQNLPVANLNLHNVTQLHVDK